MADDLDVIPTDLQSVARTLREVEIERHRPPQIVVAQCHVCSGPFAIHRLWIERMVVMAYSYSEIARQIPSDPATGKSLDRRSISTHARYHMRVEDAAARALLEEEADLLKQNVEEGIQGAMTTRGVLRVLVQKAYVDAQNDVTTVEPRDMIQMIKLLNDLETNTSTAEVEEAKTAVLLFSKAIKNVAAARRDDSLLVEIRDEIQRLRQLEEVDGAYEDHIVPPRLVGLPGGIPDATVVED